MIKIGLDGRLLQGNLTGVGKYLLNLIEYVCSHNNNIRFSIYSNRKITCKFKTNQVNIIYDKPFAAKIKPMVWSRLLLHRLINHDKPNYFLAGDAFLPSFMKPVYTLSVVHDLNALIAPETMSKLRLLTDKLFFKRDLKKANIVITNSYGTADRLLKFHNTKTDIVIYPIIDEWYKVLDEEAVRARLKELKVKQPYLLTVATREPRKNLDKTINAFASLQQKGHLADYKLLLIGSKGWKSDHIDQLLDKNQDTVQQLGYIPDETMPYLYSGADAFVFPSLYEGFGMPARESILCGVPVVTTDIPELHEATAEKAVYIDPADEAGFEEAILQTLRNKPANKQEFSALPVKDELDKLLPIFYS